MDTPPTDDPRIGAILQGRYRILAPIAAGGMGVVYRAERVGLDRPVAIKFLHALIGAHREAVARFEREARTMSRLTHPHCVAVTDFGVHDEAPYIVMELVSGPTLAEVLHHGDAPLAPVRGLAIVRQVLAGLAHAHAQGIVHRDIKPANIVLADVEGTGDHARILDFGLAKLVAGAGVSWSNTQIAVGTPSYMSPEQARGEEVDARADLYAVGILLHELLTRRKPFVAKDPLEILKLHMSAPPPPLGRDGGPRFSAELEAVVKKALTKLPAERWASALAMSEALAATPEGSGRIELAPVEIVATKPRREAEPRAVTATAGVPAAACDDGRDARDARHDTTEARGGGGRRVARLTLLVLLAAFAAAAFWMKRRMDLEDAAPFLGEVSSDAASSVPDAAGAALVLGMPDAQTLSHDASASDASPDDATLDDGALPVTDAAPGAFDAALADGDATAAAAAAPAPGEADASATDAARP